LNAFVFPGEEKRGGKGGKRFKLSSRAGEEEKRFKRENGDMRATCTIQFETKEGEGRGDAPPLTFGPRGKEKKKNFRSSTSASTWKGEKKEKYSILS